jgi:general secretion pathway protein J
MTGRASSAAGFTLVEMLIALLIFSMLAAAGVGILRSSIALEDAVEMRLGELRDLGRLEALFSSDLAQAVDRPTRGDGGQRPAFVGQSEQMQFVRGGWSNLDGSPRSNLQRVQWQLGRPGLTRTGYAHLDGSDDGASPAVLGRDVARATFRYRMASGDWSDSFVSTEREPLPTAVELTMAPARGQPVVVVATLPPSEKPEPGPGEPT